MAYPKAIRLGSLGLVLIGSAMAHGMEIDGHTEAVPDDTRALAVEESRATAIELDHLETLSQSNFQDERLGYVGELPVYANEILDPLSDWLEAQRARTTYSQYHNALQNRVIDRLRPVVLHNHILQEARASLTPRQRNAIRDIRRDKRNELIQEHGNGDVSMATARLHAIGSSLEAECRRHIDRMLIQHLVRKQGSCVPTWKEIEQEYVTRQADFVKAGTISLTRIKVSTEDNAALIQDITDAFSRGDTYAQVAQAHREWAKDWGEFSLGIDGVSGLDFIEPILDALEPLAEGDTSHAFVVGSRTMWTHVNRLIPAVERPLCDPAVQAEISLDLFQQCHTQFERLLVERLSRDGINDDLSTMSQRAISIALDRFPHPQRSSNRENRRAPFQLTSPKESKELSVGTAWIEKYTGIQRDPEASQSDEP